MQPNIEMTISAILWDFGGVLTTSPFEAFNRFEAEHGLPTDFIRGINATNPDRNAWALFESSAIGLDEFDEAFAEESAAQGYRVPGRKVVELLSGELVSRNVLHPNNTRHITRNRRFISSKSIVCAKQARVLVVLWIEDTRHAF